MKEKVLIILSSIKNDEIFKGYFRSSYRKLKTLLGKRMNKDQGAKAYNVVHIAKILILSSPDDVYSELHSN